MRVESWQSRITHHTMKLYVGNFSSDTVEANVHTIFEQFGSVAEIKVINDQETGRSRGFAFVTMNDNAEGQAAIKALDGRQFGGRAAREDRAFVAVLGTQCHGLTHGVTGHCIRRRGLWPCLFARTDPHQLQPRSLPGACSSDPRSSRLDHPVPTQNAPVGMRPSSRCCSNAPARTASATT